VSSVVFHIMIYDTIYFSTAVVLTHGNSIVHIYTQKCGPCPIFASFTLAFALQLKENHGKTSVRVDEGCQCTYYRVPVELYIVVRHIVDHNNWFRLQICNELLLQPFHIICVVHVVVVISTFLNQIGILNEHCLWNRTLHLKKNQFIWTQINLIWTVRCVFSTMNFMCYYQYGW